jgi:hypothetical protein
MIEDVGESLPNYTRYVTLSHGWGNADPLKLTR